MRKNFLLLFFFIGALSMILMSNHYLFSDEGGILDRKEVASELWYLLVFRTHILGGIIAISFGPFQFVKRLRTKHKQWHRRLGYCYVISVLLSSTTGLFVAPFAMGGLITAIGFSLLAVLWFFITLQSLLAARRGAFLVHQNWSYLSYAITFAAITQRTLLLLPLLTSIPFMPIYRLSAWLPWMFNLWLAYTFFWQPKAAELAKLEA